MDVLRLMRPLLVVAVASVALALLALLGERPVNAVAPPKILLADFADKVSAAARLEITHGLGLSGTRAIIVSLKDGQWVLAQRADYPANQELVSETLLALADVKAVAARTAHEKWHRALGLAAPENLGKAVRFKVFDSAGAVLTSVLLGNEQTSEVEAKQDVKTYGPELRQFYVRREERGQSWLARGRLPRNPNFAAWMDAAVPKHDLAQLDAVVFKGHGETLKMRRVAQASWTLTTSAPADGAVNEAVNGASWLAKFADLRPEDVARADSIDFATAQPLLLHYRDGLVLRYENVGAARVIWSRISATTDTTASAGVRTLAGAINARHQGWALRFGAARAPVLLPTRAALAHN